MSPLALWLCVILFIGSGTAADIPFVFGENSANVASYTSAQFEQVSAASVELAGVPAVSLPSDNEVLELPIVGGGNAPASTTEKREKDLKKTVSSRIEPDHSMVHEVALLLVAKFPGDLIIDQICSIYNYMKNGEGSVKGWSYARDPIGTDFFMYANQSLKIGDKSGCAGVGDCDDFAILMSALVGSIGGTTRIIFVQNKTIGGHAYAEVYLGNLRDQNCQVDEIISFLKQKFNTDKIYTHIDTDTKGVWLNLDWGVDEKGTAHPGGPFFQGDKHIVVYIREDIPNTPLKLSATKEGAELSPAVPLNITMDEIESNSAEVWFNKGFALHSLGRYDEAIKAYDEAIRLDPNLAGAWNNKGSALGKQGKYDEAIICYDEAIRLYPNYANAWSNKGSALGKQGKYDEAIKAFDEAIRLDPNYANAWYNKGETLIKQGKYDNAIKACDEAIRLDRNLAGAWTNKGVALGKQGKYADAIKACDEAIRLDPNLTMAWNNKGEALRKQGKYDEAINAFDEAIRLDPKDAATWYNKGNALNNQVKYDKAIKAYDEAIRLDPNLAQARTNKGIALKNQGKYDEAIKAYDEAIRLDPNQALAWHNKGVALGKLGKYDNAIKCFDEAIRLYPKLAAAWNAKGTALKLLGHTTEANAAFAKAKELGYDG
jgi:tetratricopeptide (TPR) repeat protein